MRNYIIKGGCLGLFILGLTACNSSQKENQGYVIKAEVTGIEDNTLVRLLDYNSKTAVIDSCRIIDGAFSFTGSVDHIDMKTLEFDSRYTYDFLLENSDISLKSDFTGLDPRGGKVLFVIEGSKSQEQYDQQKANAQSVFKKPKYKPLDELQVIYSAARKSQNPAQIDSAYKLMQKFMPLMKERSGEYLDSIFSYVEANPTSPIAVYVMGNQYSTSYMTKDKLKKYYHLFKGDACETSFFKVNMTKIYEDEFVKMMEGTYAPDFTLTSLEGEKIQLSTMKPKYKLVDFWASWCAPCRRSFPEMKELYETYHDQGFEIIGVATGDRDENWRKAIKEDQLPWVHVFDVSSRNGFGQTANDFNVKAIPHTYLVDENNKIILRNPSHEQLRNKLKELYH